MTSAGDHIFWLTTRAAGVSALVLASVAVAAGIAIHVKGGPLQGRSARLRTLHEALSLATLAAIALHGLALLGAGTDAGQPWFQLLAAVVVLPPLVLLATRWRARIPLAPTEGLTVAASHSPRG